MSQGHRMPLELHLQSGVVDVEAQAARLGAREVLLPGEMARVEETGEALGVRLEQLVNDRFRPHADSFTEVLRKELTPQQLAAVDMLVDGQTDSQTAREIGVNRATVARWRHVHPTFIAELNRRRDGVLQSASDRLRQLTLRAIDILEQRLTSPDQPELQIRAAVGLLRLAGVGHKARTIGCMSVDDMIEDRALQHRKRPEGLIDHGEREDVILDLARRMESADVEDDGV